MNNNYITEKHNLEIGINKPISGKTILVGDLHGSYFDYRQVFVENPHSNVIVLGDCGFGLFTKTEEEDLNKFRTINARCKEFDINLYLLRGNHDGLKCWVSPLRESIEKECSRVTMLRAGIVEINGKDYAIFPGALSIDRAIREIGFSKSEGEEVELTSKWIDLVAAHPNVIDGVLSHTGKCPTTLGSSVVDYWARYDVMLREDIQKEQNELSTMLGIIEGHNLAISGKSNITQYYGHYHTSWDSKETTAEGSTICYKCLNCSEVYHLV